MKKHLLSLLGPIGLSLFSFSLLGMEETKPSICDPTLKDKINYRPAPLFAPDLKKLPYKCEGPVMEAFESERFRIKFKAIK